VFQRGGEEVVSVESATTWCSRHCPGIWDAVHLCTRLALFGGHSIGLVSLYSIALLVSGLSLSVNVSFTHITLNMPEI